MPGGLEQNLTFKEDRISLDIPKEGINVDTWIVKPAALPTVSSSYISCTLKLKNAHHVRIYFFSDPEKGC